MAVLVARIQLRLFATTGYSTRILLLATGFRVPVMFGSGNQLILTVIIHPLGCVEHILRDQFHGRRELAGQDCDLFVESADLRGKLVDDVVRVGWNLLSQNSLLKYETPAIRVDCRG